MRELHVLGNKSLQRHPNILRLQKIGWGVSALMPLEICPILYIERAPCGTLVDLEKADLLPDYEARKRLCNDVSEGIAALHAHGIAHGDLKADNILVFQSNDTGYTAKISDFGCSVIIGKHNVEYEGRTIRLPGMTPPWNAPEALEPIPIQHLEAKDVYSLGLLLWRILMFCDPFTFFDLPLNPALRMGMIQEILSFVSLPNSDTQLHQRIGH